jgi:hypothetical protein
MGTSYTQKAIVGVRLPVEDIKSILSEAQYRYEPRFDTKTGKQTHETRVLVKEAKSVYTFKDLSSEDIYELAEQIESKYKLTTLISDEVLYVGLTVGGRIDYGNVRLIQKEVSFTELSEMFEYVRKIIPNPSLCFATDVG